MAKSDTNYSSLSIELGDILAKLQQPGIQIDEAIKMYRKGVKLIEQLEMHLEKAENNIETLRLAASGVRNSASSGTASAEDGSGS